MSEIYKFIEEGFEVEVSCRTTAAFISHLQRKIQFWKDAATTYKKAIDLIYEKERSE